jgi:hypothetical protein
MAQLYFNSNKSSWFGAKLIQHRDKYTRSSNATTYEHDNHRKVTDNRKLSPEEGGGGHGGRATAEDKEAFRYFHALADTESE